MYWAAEISPFERVSISILAVTKAMKYPASILIPLLEANCNWILIILEMSAFKSIVWLFSLIASLIISRRNKSSVCGNLDSILPIKSSAEKPLKEIRNSSAALISIGSAAASIDVVGGALTSNP